MRPLSIELLIGGGKSWWTGEQAIHNSQWSSCIFAPCRLRRPQRLPCVRGAVGVSRLKGCPCGLRFAPCPQFGMVVPHRSQARLRLSLVPTIRNSRLATLPLASLLCSLDFRFACFAHCARRSSVPLGARFVRPPPLPHPQFAMVAPLRSQARLRLSLAYWAYYGLFRALRAAFVRPLPVSAKILRIFGRGNCKEAIFALENGIFRRKNRPVPAVHAAGDDCTAKGLRFHNSQWSPCSA